MTQVQRLPRPDFACRMLVQAPIGQTFDSIATLDGLGGWWTPLASGSADKGGEIRLDFEGHSFVVLRVGDSSRPRSVRWECVDNSALPEWAGTTLAFDLAELGPAACELSFEHRGLRSGLDCYDLCSGGWEHYLGSLAAYAEHGTGRPFGSGPRG
jgi:hypothetical protein